MGAAHWVPHDVYPFERFTEDGKRTLTLAQEEAEHSHHSYIGTEHLLLGLLRLPSGPARTALQDLAIDIHKVRETIASVIGREERILSRQIIPTSRVKTVIEIAFEEARGMGSGEVNSGHLLMALAIEGEGIAAHVLADLGAGEKEVVAAVERALSVPPRERPEPRRMRPFRPPTSPPGGAMIPQSRMMASTGEGPPTASDLETLHRLLRTSHIASLLRAKGLTDLEGLQARLAHPPETVRSLRVQLQTVHNNLTAAVNLQRFDEASRLQKRQRELARKLDRAEQEWLRKLVD